MGKKYLDTKKDSLEQSILGVWKTAVEEGSGRMDGKEHRKKLESVRTKRESTIKTEEVDLEEKSISVEGFEDTTAIAAAVNDAGFEFGGATV